MWNEKVIQLLKKCLPKSEGTTKFLSMMRDFYEAFCDPTLSPLERLEKTWYSLFILRIWRQNIASQKHLRLKHKIVILVWKLTPIILFFCYYI